MSLKNVFKVVKASSGNFRYNPSLNPLHSHNCQILIENSAALGSRPAVVRNP